MGVGVGAGAGVGVGAGATGVFVDGPSFPPPQAAKSAAPTTSDDHATVHLELTIVTPSAGVRFATNVGMARILTSIYERESPDRPPGGVVASPEPAPPRVIPQPDPLVQDVAE
jgi:hypothetical protein